MNKDWTRKDHNLLRAFQQTIEEMRQELEALREKYRWIPVSERLPSIGVPVLCKASGPSSPFIGSLNHTATWVDYHGLFRDPDWWRPIDMPEGAGNG